MFRFSVFTALWCVVYADNGTNFDGASFTYVGTNRTINENCKDCVSKCCPGTQFVLNDNCVENVHGIKKLQDMEVEIYDNDISKTEQSLKKFTFVYSDIFNSSDAYLLEPASGEELYLLENGDLYLRRLNYLNQWGDPFSYKSFCLELQVSSGPDGEPVAGTEKLIYKQILGVYVQGKTKDDIVAGGDMFRTLREFFFRMSDLAAMSCRCCHNLTLDMSMLISCFFLLLVFATYAVLPQKRNLPSLMLMAYVACLATAFLFIAVQVFTEGQAEKTQCVAIGLTVYYTFLASFTWLNVMSYDMWSTTCKSLSLRWEPRRRILAKFGWYSVYGFGVPLLTTLFLVSIDYADLTSVPGFVKPHFVFGYMCTFESEDERKLYVNAPMLVATVINIIFFVITGLFIWRNSAKPGGSGESRNTKKDTSRFIIYLKLTLIMGVNWILDVASAFFSPDSWVWYLPDVFNSLVGLFIFIIFVCKKDMFLLLCKRFSIETNFVRQWESTVDTSESISKGQLSDKKTGSTIMISEGSSDKLTGVY